MKKLLSLISTLVIGASLAVGVGSAAYNKGTVEANAAVTSPYNFSSIPTSGWKTAGSTVSINGVTWTYTSSTYIANGSSKIQVGSSKNPQTSDWTISTPVSSFGTNIVITSISATAYTTATTATYSIDASSNLKAGSLTTSSTVYTVNNLSISSGNISVTLKGSGTSKAMYLANICVVFQAQSGSVSVTGISLDKAEASLIVGNQLKLNHTIAPSNATNNAVTWSSSNESVATVNNGTVTAVSAGTTIITVKTEDGDFTATCNVTVSNFVGTTYSLIESIDDLFVGQEVVIGVADDEKAHILGSTQNSNNRSAVKATFADDKITPDTEGCAVFTLGIQENSDGTVVYTLHDDNGFLYDASSGSKNYLKSQEINDEDGQFTINITDGVSIITSVGGSNKVIKYNSSNNIFSCYASTSQIAVSLFSIQTATFTQKADAFEIKYMHMSSVQTSSTGTGLCSSKGWYIAAKTAYNALDDDTILEFSDNHVAAYNRLLAWATANGDQLDGDMRLVSMRITSQLNSFEFNSNSSITFIVLAVICGCATFGFVSLTKKRKHN